MEKQGGFTVVKKAFTEFNIILEHCKKLTWTWETHKNLSFQKLHSS